MKIADLLHDPANARKHDERNLSAIKGSLVAFGQQKPIVIDEKNVVLAGNGTLEAAKSLGWTEIDCVVTDLKTSTDKKAFALADNRTSELASWDTDILSDALKGLTLDDFDITSIGFDLPGLDTPPEGLTDPDDVPEDVDTRAKPGDIWILGNHRVMCGDSTNIQHVEKLMNGEKADMVFTDPPYGVGYKYKSHDDNVTQEEHFFFLRTLMAQSLLFSSRIIITPGCKNLPMMINARNDFTHVGCWIKTNAMSPGRVTYFWTWEPIFFYGKFKRKRGNDVFNYPVGTQPDTGDHTCPKPIALWLDIVENFSEPKDSILDFFLGSGSTLIACEKTDRKCYGMEIDPHYVDVILSRWEKFTGKTAKLEEK